MVCSCDDYEVCPGCGLVLPASAGTRHPYFGASAACWHVFSQLLAREYADPAYMTMHRVTVDAYAAQHPGEPEPRSIQSVNVHLVGLYLVLECGLQPAFAGAVIGQLTKKKKELHWLPPPAFLGPLTVMDVIATAAPAEHAAAVRQWGLSVWTAWTPYHATIAVLAQRAMNGLR